MKLLRGVLIAFGALVALIIAGAGFAVWQYNHAMTISAANGIDESRYVRIGGIEQWVQIRGQDKANPILLWLNGGPGCSTATSMTYFTTEWEEHFTVVMWDQRGEGKTFKKSGTSVAPTMTIGQMTRDGLELTDYLRKKLHKDKIILVGHSWGSILGVHMVSLRPDLFSAYVGTGQVRQPREDAVAVYPRILARARAQNNMQAISELEAIGPPPYKQSATYNVLAKLAGSFDRFPLLSPGGLWAVLQDLPCYKSPGAVFSQNILATPILDENLSSVAPKLDVPVFIIVGAEDLVTPGAKPFFDHLAAPQKEILLIEGAGHIAALSQGSAFLNFLLEKVLPAAAARRL